MWLERFSGHSTPSGSPPPPQTRGYSPAPPRQPSNLGLGVQAARPAYSPRASSLSLGLSPNESVTSLPDPSRRPNGSALRRQISRSPPLGVADPLEVLSSILRAPAGTNPGDQGDSDLEKYKKPRNLIHEIDFDGLSLEDYAAQGLSLPDHKESPSGTEPYTIDRYRRERDRYQELHNATAGCDEVLQSVELYLTNFQAELGAVSAEIENLQSGSVHLNAKLDNRRKVEKLLGPAVEEISISPGTVRMISEGPIDEKWIKALNELETRSATVKAKSTNSQGFKAVEDVKPLLDKLKNKAIERIRDYIVAQIKSLRSPNINVQVLQQQTFIKYKELYAFLGRNHKVLADEIAQAYINTMRWYYSQSFTRYQQALDKLKLHAVDKTDVLGAEQSSQRGNVLAAARSGVAARDPFSLGRRADVLKTTSKSAISSHLAEEDKLTHFLEVPFHNFNAALIDNISAEYAFVTELFSTIMTFQQTSRKVIEIFDPVFALGHSLTKRLVENTVDCLGVLLCVRLNQHSAFELQRRKVPVADSYINGANMLLWPRFQIIMDLHCESLKRIASSSGRSAASALSLSAPDTSKQSSAPHLITQRFGQFLHGILALSSEAGDNEPVSNSLGRLRAEFEALLMKLSKSAGDAKRRERFLFNNYSLVLTIISDTHGKLAEEQKEYFEEHLRAAKDRR